MKRKTKRLLPMILVFTIIAAAYSCRMLAMSDIGGDCISYIRAALYLLLFALWGFSLDRRIIQTQALHCMRLTAALMLVWLVLRTLKYEVVTDLTAARYIWYLYYLPMLFIPLLGVYIALSLGRSEEFRLTGKMGALAIIPAVLFLLVITNDLHQQAFTGQLVLFPRSRLLLLPRLDGGLHVFFSYPPFEEKPHSGQPEKEDHTVCYRLRNGSVRDLVSVGAAGCTPVVRRYECDVLPIICGNL